MDRGEIIRREHERHRSLNKLRDALADYDQAVDELDTLYRWTSVPTEVVEAASGQASIAFRKLQKAIEAFQSSQPTQ